MPPAIGWIYDLNPMVAVIEGFRWALLGAAVDARLAAAALGRRCPFAILVSGAFFFRRIERTFADEL